MRSGLINFNWDDIDSFSEEQISYYLYLEGKSIKVISKIRNIEEAAVQKHVINGKIKYRILSLSKNCSELLDNIASSVKQEKLTLLSTMENERKEELLKFINENYASMTSKHKETAIWIIGELKDKNQKSILIKAAVNKSVNVRRMAVSAIGKIKDKSFESTLLRVLDDENDQVIVYAIKALIKNEIKSAKEKIIKIKEKTNKEYIKNACEEYLKIVNE